MWTDLSTPRAECEGPVDRFVYGPRSTDRAKVESYCSRLVESLARRCLQLRDHVTRAHRVPDTQYHTQHSNGHHDNAVRHHLATQPGIAKSYKEGEWGVSPPSLPLLHFSLSLSISLLPKLTLLTYFMQELNRLHLANIEESKKDLFFSFDDEII